MDNVMDNTTIINIFNSNNNNVASIKTENSQIMKTVRYQILKFEPMIKKSIVANHAFLAVTTFSRTSSFTYIKSIVIQHL